MFFKLAKEGKKLVLLSFLISIIAFFIVGFWSIPFWLFFLFNLQFYREPLRISSFDVNEVISPADGKVISVEKIKQNQTEVIKISIFMNVFNVHSNKIPISGKIRSINYHQGKFFNASLDKASDKNEKNEVVIITDDGDEFKVVQIAGLIARRILCYCKVGDPVITGDKYGFIRFGSRVDLFMPNNFYALVAIGDKVKGGLTKIAIKHD